MRIPIKFNRMKLPSILRVSRLTADDPRAVVKDNATAEEYTVSIGMFKFGNTFKTTKSSRYPKTIKKLLELGVSKASVVLDVGASDGSASLDVMRAISYEKYFLTDWNLSAIYQPTKLGALFLNKDHNPVLFASDRFVAYADFKKSIWPFGWIAKLIIRRAERKKSGQEKHILLLNPSVFELQDGRIKVREHDVLVPWSGEKASLVIVANLLNRSYFSDEQILTAVGNLKGALETNGVLAVIENRKLEQSTIFRLKDGGFKVEGRVGPGSDIEPLILGLN